MNNLTNTLLQLLRAALEPTVSPPSIPRLTEEDWNRLFTLAAQHGVTALLFDTILRLPEQQQPSRALKIRWALSSEAIEKRHAQQTRAAHELTTLFASHGVRTILLKGLGLSIYYPRPEHRECGDIDLWLDDCDKGNRLIEELGIKINHDSEKHAVFHYKGVMVENHSHLLMPSHRRTERAIDDFLVGEAENSRLAPAGYYTPSPMFNALYLLRHMARHFGTEGINLRHLLDWGLFLRSEQSEIDFEKILTLYAATGYDTVYNIFTALAGELLDEDFTPLPNAEHFEDIYGQKSIVEAFKEAGFKTIFLSNQTPNRTFTDYFAAAGTGGVRRLEPGRRRAAGLHRRRGVLPAGGVHPGRGRRGVRRGPG